MQPADVHISIYIFSITREIQIVNSNFGLFNKFNCWESNLHFLHNGRNERIKLMKRAC